MDPFDPMNPMQSHLPMGMFQPQPPRLSGAFGLSGPQGSAGVNPQQSRLAQAFAPPVKPTFTDPQKAQSMYGIQGILGPQGPQGKPRGPITPQINVAPDMQQQAPQVTEQPKAQSHDQFRQNNERFGDPHANNAWLNPAQLAGMGGAKGAGSPGDGLLSFLSSGAPAAFASGSGASGGALQGPTPLGPSLDTTANGSGGLYSPADMAAKSGGGIGPLGEPGSVANMLTGGEMDPKSALGGLLKLFGGFGGF